MNDIAADTSWAEYAAAPVQDWDWEAARLDGKLVRFGYQGDRVLVLVVSMYQEPYPAAA